MRDKKALPSEIYQQAVEFLRIGNEAVRKAQQESFEAGIPTVHSLDGRLYWRLPDGEITFEDPWREGAPPSSAPGAGLRS